jgi:segregation and condensation protein A
MICLFLALLEMVKQQALKLTQKESFGEIHAKRDAGFDALLTSDDQVARIENDYKN